MAILKIISEYMNMIELKKMMDTSTPVADITYDPNEQQKLADIRELIVKDKIFLTANAIDISTMKKYIYMEPLEKDQNKGGKHTSRRARKSKKSIRKSKLRRRHRK